MAGGGLWCLGDLTVGYNMRFSVEHYGQRVMADQFRHVMTMKSAVRVPAESWKGVSKVVEATHTMRAPSGSDSLASRMICTQSLPTCRTVTSHTRPWRVTVIERPPASRRFRQVGAILEAIEGAAPCRDNGTGNGGGRGRGRGRDDAGGTGAARHRCVVEVVALEELAYEEQLLLFNHTDALAVEGRACTGPPSYRPAPRAL